MQATLLHLAGLGMLLMREVRQPHHEVEARAYSLSAAIGEGQFAEHRLVARDHARLGGRRTLGFVRHGVFSRCSCGASLTAGVAPAPWSRADCRSRRKELDPAREKTNLGSKVRATHGDGHDDGWRLAEWSNPG